MNPLTLIHNALYSHRLNLINAGLWHGEDQQKHDKAAAALDALRAAPTIQPSEAGGVQYPTKDAYMAACRALHWRTAELRAHGIEPIAIPSDAPHDPPDDFDFGARHPPAPAVVDVAGDTIRRAEEWLRTCSGWMLSNDLDMGCPMLTDPLDLADELAALAQSAPVDEDEIICEACMKPVLRGQFVHCYTDVGEVHVDCERPFALTDDPQAVIMAGEPLRRVRPAAATGVNSHAQAARYAERLELEIADLDDDEDALLNEVSAFLRSLRPSPAPVDDAVTQEADRAQAVDLVDWLTERLMLEGPGKLEVIQYIEKAFRNHRLRYRPAAPVDLDGERLHRRIAALRQIMGMSALQARCADRDGEWTASSLFNDLERALQARPSGEGAREAFESGYNAGFGQIDDTYDLGGAWAQHISCGAHVHVDQPLSDRGR